jgi:bifunctional DNA-binding transcriptional regulator/antitoxin component of YhaV-PrlF toxin-antitoxin module
MISCLRYMRVTISSKGHIVLPEEFRKVDRINILNNEELKSST